MAGTPIKNLPETTTLADNMDLIVEDATPATKRTKISALMEKAEAAFKNWSFTEIGGKVLDVIKSQGTTISGHTETIGAQGASIEAISRDVGAIPITQVVSGVIAGGTTFSILPGEYDKTKTEVTVRVNTEKTSNTYKDPLFAYLYSETGTDIKKYRVYIKTTAAAVPENIWFTAFIRVHP